MFSLQTIFGQGKQFYSLLDEAAVAAHDSTKALHEMLRPPDRTPSLTPSNWPAARARRSDRISQALVDSFIHPDRREDSKRWGRPCNRSPAVRTLRRPLFAARHRLEGLDFAPRASMLEQAAGVVVEMVRNCRPAPGTDEALNDRLRVLEPKPTA